MPGLLQVMRAGNVVVSNVPGAGFVESPGLHAFLPAISQRLLGQSLVLPSVQTWWCGEAPAADYVIDNLADLVIKPAHSGIRFEPVF